MTVQHEGATFNPRRTTESALGPPVDDPMTTRGTFDVRYLCEVIAGSFAVIVRGIVRLI